MSSTYEPVADHVPDVIVPEDGDDADVLSIAATQRLADSIAWVEQSELMSTLGGGHRVLEIPGLFNKHSVQCEEIPVTVLGGPSSVIAGLDDDIDGFPISEDGGLTWSNPGLGEDLNALAIGRLGSAMSGWIIYAVGDGGLYRGHYRSATRTSISPAISGNVTSPVTPDFRGIIFDEPNRGVGGQNHFRFWAWGDDGLWRGDGTVSSFTWTRKSSNPTFAVRVTSSGRVVALQTISSVKKLAYSDDGGATAFVTGASLSAFTTLELQLDYDEDADVLVLALDDTTSPFKLIWSEDGGATVSSVSMPTNCYVRVVGPFRGRMIFLTKFSTEAPGTNIRSLYFRKTKAWSTDLADPTKYRSMAFDDRDSAPKVPVFSSCRWIRSNQGIGGPGAFLIGNYIAMRE